MNVQKQDFCKTKNKNKKQTTDMGPKMSYLDILNWNLKKEKQQNLLIQVPN